MFLYDLFIGQASFGPRSAVLGWRQQFACGPPAGNESLDACKPNPAYKRMINDDYIYYV